MKIKITADSTCDLSQELVEKNGITIVPLYVTCEEKTYLDGVDIQPTEMLARTEASGGVAKTAAVNIQEYMDLFGKLLQEYDAIVHFTISSQMSACYQNACLAAQELGHVYVVDSENLSTGIGHLVLDACELAQRGMEAEDIKKELDGRKKKLDVSFVLSTLEYLRRGGRCTTVAALGANLLKLHPCIVVKNGAMGVGKKYRGHIQDCLVAYVKDRLADAENIDPRRIFITDSGFDDETRDLVEKTVRQCVPFQEVIRTQAGCTVSCHCGPGCLGVLFYRK
jgi:DegV family protein with EDD domain